MPYVKYRAKNFPRHYGPSFIGKHDLPLSWEEVVWAAITMGKPGVAFLLTHGWHSMSDMVVRSHTIYANLRQSSGFIEQSSLYEALDPTEKGATSYFMGMLAAKIVGARLLGVPWLFHLSMLGPIGWSWKLIGNSQPDLVGLTRSRDWVVAEAKGRSGGYSAKAMAAAKLQTRQLRRINGQLPSLRVAIQAFFNSHMEWAIEDPEEFDEQAPDLNFDVQAAFDRYYSAAMSATEVSDERSIADRKFRARAVPEIGVTIGIDSEIRERVRARALDATLEQKAIGPLSHTADGEFVVFPDGVAIALDERWAGHRMTQDPTMRREA